MVYGFAKTDGVAEKADNSDRVEGRIYFSFPNSSSVKCFLVFSFENLSEL